MQKPRVVRHEVVQPPDQSIKYIALTKGQTAIVDAANYEWLKQWNWSAFWHPRTKTFYARRGHAGPLMHRVIFNAQPTQLLDHKSGDTLDNRRQNIRFATSSQNAQNRKTYSSNKSGHKGVYWNAANSKWVAQIGTNGRNKYLGSFMQQSEAIAARLIAEHENFGEFAFAHRLTSNV